MIYALIIYFVGCAAASIVHSPALATGRFTSKKLSLIAISWYSLYLFRQMEKYRDQMLVHGDVSQYPYYSVTTLEDAIELYKKGAIRLQQAAEKAS